MAEHEAEPELLLDKHASTFLVPPGLLDDYAGFDMADTLRRAMNGEQVFKPLPPPRRHRCLGCWLVSLLPGHDRCSHGYLTCNECDSDY